MHGAKICTRPGYYGSPIPEWDAVCRRRLCGVAAHASNRNGHTDVAAPRRPPGIVESPLDRARPPRPEKRGGGRSFSERLSAMPKPFKPTRPFRLPAACRHPRPRGAAARPAEGPWANRSVPTDEGRDQVPPPVEALVLRPPRRVRHRPATVKGFADLKATEQLAAEMERKASRVRSGYHRPGRRTRPPATGRTPEGLRRSP